MGAVSKDDIKKNVCLDNGDYEKLIRYSCVVVGVKKRLPLNEFQCTCSVMLILQVENVVR